MTDRFDVLGVPVSATTMTSAVAQVIEWGRGDTSRIVFVREVASLMAAVEEPRLRDLHSAADLVVPDGMPLVWIGKLRGYGAKIGRVSGADLLEEVCRASVATGQSHYFYGGRPGVAEAVAKQMAAKYEGINIVGTFSPPMRQLGPNFSITQEIHDEIEVITHLKPDFIWVGISSPKQEYWMAQLAPIVGQGVFFGIGAAFDFHAGTVKRAPIWMQRAGLEWLSRLASEPRRLWRRYLIKAPKFVILSIIQAFGDGSHRRASKSRL